jgi:hypothetical protein
MVVKRVFKVIGRNENFSATKGGELANLERLGRLHCEKLLHGPADDFADGSILIRCKPANLSHEWIWEENLNFLHGYMFYMEVLGVNREFFLREYGRERRARSVSGGVSRRRGDTGGIGRMR